MMTVFTRRLSAIAFGHVRWNRDSSSAHLRDKAPLFGCRQFTSNAINLSHDFHTFLANEQIFVTEDFVPIPAIAHCLLPVAFHVSRVDMLIDFVGWGIGRVEGEIYRRLNFG
jgi:hypothetical protein